MKTSGSLTEIVLTGGPCGGKTSAREYITERLSDLGVRTFFVPEVATLVISGGVPDIGALAAQPERYLELQRQILFFTQDLKTRFRALAELFGEERRVILYDRAEMDAIAYLDPDPHVARAKFMALLQETRLTLHDVRDSYDAVIHLVSAAEGAEWAYTLANNRARQETAAQARLADQRTQQAWIGHPHLRVIDNRTDFEGKLKATFQAITRVIGIPVPLEIERKFLLRGVPDFAAVPELRDAQRIEIEQIYLRTDDPQEHLRIRRRGQRGQETYYLTRKRTVAPGVRQELEERIRPSEYLRYAARQHPQTQIVRKDRWCFVYRGQYLELDVISEPASRACVLLEIELTEENRAVELPPFLDVLADVTDDPRYENWQIAQG